MPVPYTSFGTATSAIPLSELDANFAAPITLGNTAIQLGNTVTTLNNMTLANVTISSGNVTITNVGITNANVSGTANISTLVVVGNATVGGNTTITGNITAANANVTTNLVLSNGTANGVAYLNVAKVLTTGSALTFNGNNLSVVGTYAINQTNLFEINNGQSGATKFASGVSLTSDSGGNYTSAFYVVSGSNTRYNLITGTPTDLLFYSANTEAMRLTSTSLYTASTINVGIGTSSPLGLLNIKGSNGQLVLNNGASSGGMRLSAFTNAGTANGYLAFEGYSLEYGRFDASGNLLVGTTTAGVNNTNGLTVVNPTSGTAISIGHVTGTANTAGFAFFGYDGTTIGSITQSGTTAVLYNLTSDQRLKENIADADSASTLIDSLQVRKFDWKTDNTHQRYGFIAQELVTVAPEAVYAPIDPDEMMAVDYSKLVPMLVKEIQSLRKRLAAANL